MAEKIYGIPFDANEIILPDGTPGYDNVLYAQDLADWLKTYFKNGVLVPGGALISTELQVTKVDDTTVRINTGNIVINGRTGFNKNRINLTVDKAIPNNERWDRAIVELNLDSTVNSFRFLIIQGILSETPSAPDLVRDDKVYQMSLATIKISEVGVYEIVDDRVNEGLCGISQVLIGVRPPLPVTGDSADNISYDNSISGLSATTIQTAIDDLVTPVNTYILSAGDKWIEDTASSSFKQDISVVWATSKAQAIVDVVPSKRSDTILWGSIWKVETNAGKVTFYSSERLTSSLTVKIKEVI